MLTEYRAERCDALVALHAVKSAGSVERFRAANPGRRVAVAVTGTDLYADPATRDRAVATLRAADRVVVLQDAALADLSGDVRRKAVVVYQSAAAPGRPPAERTDSFPVCVLGHLRAVKDPFRAAEAARLLPEASRVRVLHIGAALSPEFAKRASAETRKSPRYRWLGELPRGRAVRVLARCRLLVMSSLSEGGPSAVSEALACGVPVLSTPVAGVVGVLGDGYPGYFPVGDTRALADLLGRCEADPAFVRALAAWCRGRKSLVSPARERRSWRRLARELAG